MADFKEYRPKADAGENLTVTVMIPDTATGGKQLNISSWPYAPKNADEDAALDTHPLLTNQPAPTPSGASTKKGDS